MANNTDKKNKTKKFVPSEYKPKEYIDRDSFTEEQIADVRAEAELAFVNKQVSRISVVSVIWTIISTLYAIISTCFLVARKWVDSTAAYILIGILVLYVGMFIGMAVMSFGDLKGAKKKASGFKTATGFMKVLMHIVLIALAIVEVVGVSTDLDAGKLIVLIATLVVVVVQLGIKITLLFAKAARKRETRGYKVNIERYVDGAKQKKKFTTKLKEKKYSD